MKSCKFLLSFCLAAAPCIGSADDCHTDVKPYAVPVSPDYAIQPLLSVGEDVARTGNPAKLYQMVGIPDGLGVHRLAHGKTALFMNHEFVQGVISEPNVGDPLQRGSFVSRFVLDKDGCVVSGERAFDTVYNENALVGPAAEVGNATPAFSRLCSGSLAWQDAGFDRPIYFAGEESSSPGTFDVKGGSAVAIFDKEAHVLPRLGHLPYENILAQPDAGRNTVLMVMEDGPSTTDSQLFMYVGRRQSFPGATALRRNGLDNGELYVFVPTTPGMTSEVPFQTGMIDGTWVKIPDAHLLDEVQLEAAADAAGAFGFIRTEDGAFSKRNKNEYYFVTTGGNVGNQLGRLYRLDLNKFDVTGPCKLSVIYNADAVDAAGGDTAFSPDNIDTSRDYVMVCEDGTAQSRPKMTSRARDGSIWRFDIKNNYAAERVVELNPPGTDANPVTAGVWETSGIIDASAPFGKDTWIFDVQAHSPTTAPEPNTIEDGQLLMLIRSCVNPDGDKPHNH